MDDLIERVDLLTDEELAHAAAMNQWRKSLKRPDMKEEDRVKGALLAYERQLLACALLSALRDRSAP